MVLLLADGEAQGSAVLLRHLPQGSWLVTNRHVVQGLTQLCVRSADGRLRPGLIVLPQGRQASLDVAFIWLSGDAGGLPVALLSSDRPVAMTVDREFPFPIVRAGGYPVPEQRQATAPEYREIPGLLLPLLTIPLAGGMQLAYTSPVRKGMSGGGLFDEAGRLIGINTTHPNPLWQAGLQDEAGRPIAEPLNSRLELVALAIPLNRILPLLDQLRVPGDASGRSGAAINSKTTERRSAAAGATDQVCQGKLW